jgi:hypothetical protein
MACKSEKEDVTPLIGTTWKLVGFVDAQADTMKTAEPVGDQCYLLTFHQDGTLSGYTSTNEAGGEYEINTQTGSLIIKSFGGLTMINELFDGNRYIECMYKVTYYNLSDKNLKLYYSPTDYLLFNPYEL